MYSEGDVQQYNGVSKGIISYQHFLSLYINEMGVQLFITDIQYISIHMNIDNALNYTSVIDLNTYIHMVLFQCNGPLSIYYNHKYNHKQSQVPN